MAMNVSRREFLQHGALAAGALAAGGSTLLDPGPAFAARPRVSPSDVIGFGSIGVGMQGNGLLSTAITLPGVQCLAAADLYDGRQTLAKEIAGEKIFTTRRYQELLARPDVQAVIVAVPDHWHKQVVLDALSAGKDVYCEKPMSHSLADGAEMAAAHKRSDRIVQIGSQRTSSAILAKARELFQQGAIGELLMAELTLGRNDPTGAWEYPPPPDLSPATLDWDTWLGTAPKKAFDPLAFARWRCWKEYGTGVAGDLMVHLVSGMQFVTGINQVPDRAFALGGIRRWPDGRNMPDLQTVLFQYGNVPVYVRLTLGTETPERMRLMGPKGVLDVSETELQLQPQRGIDTYPSYYAYSFPRALRDAYFAQWHQEHDARPGQEYVGETTSYRGISYDDVKPHLYHFFEAVRTRTPVVQDATFGHHAAGACHMANESYFRQAAVSYDAAKEKLKV